MNSELADVLVIEFNSHADTRGFQHEGNSVMILQTVCDGLCDCVYVDEGGHAHVNLMDPWQRSVLRRLLDAIEESTT